MAKHTTAQLATLQAQAWAMHQQGATMGAIQAKLGLNYSQAWLGIAAHTMAQPSHQHLNHVGQHTGAALAQAIAAARNQRGQYSSWGWLAVRFGMPESRVRTLYSQATNTHHVGLRIGKGGRFASGLAGQYVGPAAKLGIVRPLGNGAPATTTVAPAAPANAAPASMASLRKAARAAGMANASKANRQALLAYLANAGQ